MWTKNSAGSPQWWLTSSLVYILWFHFQYEMHDFGSLMWEGMQQTCCTILMISIISCIVTIIMLLQTALHCGLWQHHNNIISSTFHTRLVYLRQIKGRLHNLESVSCFPGSHTSWFGLQARFNLLAFLWRAWKQCPLPHHCCQCLSWGNLCILWWATSKGKNEGISCSKYDQSVWELEGNFIILPLVHQFQNHDTSQGDREREGCSQG